MDWEVYKTVNNGAYSVIVWVTSDKMTSDVIMLPKRAFLSIKCHVTCHKITRKRHRHSLPKQLPYS
jgi:hypothetical protein